MLPVAMVILLSSPGADKPLQDENRSASLLIASKAAVECWTVERLGAEVTPRQQIVSSTFFSLGTCIEIWEWQRIRNVAVIYCG